MRSRLHKAELMENQHGHRPTDFKLIRGASELSPQFPLRPQGIIVVLLLDRTSVAPQSWFNRVRHCVYASPPFWPRLNALRSSDGRRLPHRFGRLYAPPDGYVIGRGLNHRALYRHDRPC